MKSVSDTNGSFETLEEYPVFQQYARQFRRPPRAESAMKHPISLKEMRQAAHCFSRSRKGKVFGTHTPCKNKHFKD